MTVENESIKKMRYGVLITSAINTKFGIYNTEQRTEQTLATIANVKSKIPDAKIFLLEMSGIGLSEDQKNLLMGKVDHLIDFSTDKNVVGLFNSTDNWDVVKNVTEVMCFRAALKTLLDSGVVFHIDRFFKVSGRYLLNDDFDINYYSGYKVKPCIVVAKRKDSQFPYQLTQVEQQFMSRLWSWPADLTEEILGVYTNSLNYMYERLQAKGYADIEHCLFKFLDHDKLIEKGMVGIQGNIGPNGVAVND